MNIAQQMNSLALDATLEAARSGKEHKIMVREQAVIAEEIRTIALRIMAAVEQNTFGKLPEDEFEIMMSGLVKRALFLSTNSALISFKADKIIQLSIITEELRALSCRLAELYKSGNKSPQLPRDYSVAYPVSRVISGTVVFFTAVTGEYTWRENADNVVEIFYYDPCFITGNRFKFKNEWRDMDYPIIDLRKQNKNDDIGGIVIISDACDPKKLYAVYTDEHGFVEGQVGVNKPCGLDIPVRECWAASGGGDIIFPDWERIAEKEEH
jgi:hypothetical protein